MMVLCVVDGVEGGFGRDVAALLLLLLLLSGWQPVQYLCLFEMVGALPHVAHVLSDTLDDEAGAIVAAAPPFPPLVLFLMLLSGWHPVQYLCLFEMVGALPHVAHVLVETDETVPVDFAAVALTLPPPPLLFLSLSLLLSGWHLTQYECRLDIAGFEHDLQDLVTVLVGDVVALVFVDESVAFAGLPLLFPWLLLLLSGWHLTQ
jgi:hypothetical protein